MTFRTVEQEITPILKRYKATRCDDMLLYSKYVYYKGALIIPTLTDVSYRKEHNIAPYETVSRIRRKIQERYAELRPTPAQIAEKKRAEKEYKEYART